MLQSKLKLESSPAALSLHLNSARSLKALVDEDNEILMRKASEHDLNLAHLKKWNDEPQRHFIITSLWLVI